MTEEIEKLRRDLQIAQETIKLKDRRVTQLNAEVQDLRAQIATLQKTRPKLAPEHLITSFRSALVKMQEGLELGKGRVDYTISKFDTDLKVAVVLDDEGNVAFQLPELEDTVPFENLSQLRLSLVPVGRPPTPPPETAEVPNLMGMSKEVAVKTIESARFTVGAVEERTSTRAPGTVIGQDPDPFCRAQVESPIDVIVSELRNVKVPGVVGLSRNDAIEVLRSARLAIGKIATQASTSPAGTVIDQSIAANSLVPIETQIDLIVSRQETVVVPGIVGRPLDEARAAIDDAELRVGRISEQESRKPVGTVLDQKPEAGETVPVGTPVQITVARILEVAVPELIGLKLEEAKRVCAESSLEAGNVIQRISPKPVGTVIGQQPEPGTKVPAGTAIRLTLSAGRRP